MRIAVLNRGEAATRCLRAVRELQIEEQRELVGIALYTTPDRFAAFVREADESISLGAPLRRSTSSGELRPAYLDHERVLAAIRATRADAVWPGWGFLAEDPAFVERLEAAGITFLGPSAETMRALGDKMTAKRFGQEAGVPVLPWSGGAVERNQLAEVASKIGFPLLLKASAGGGGRGIRLVEGPDELEANFDRAESEAAHAFGDGTLFLEKLERGARHVEVQMVADRHGRVLAVGLRDCSVQRRYQKVVEEGPPPGIPAALSDELRQASVRLLERVGYLGVATCEYLVTDDGRFWFLEVNPRLQVEHGITESLTEFDLVKWQIRVARGDALPEAAPSERGHAIEVRLCAEDAAAGFVPSPGYIAMLDLPSGPGIRVDSGASLHETIPSEFDSMIAKVIARGSTREEARVRLIRALRDLRVVIEAGMTNKGFLLDVLESDTFRRGEVRTDWLDHSNLAREPEPAVEVLLGAAILSYVRERDGVRLNFYSEATRGRPQHIPPSSGREIDLVYAGQAYRLQVFAVGDWGYRIYLESRVVELQALEPGPHSLQLLLGNRRYSILYSESDIEIRLEVEGRQHRLQRDVGGRVRAPAPALVIEITVRPGDSVAVGDRIGLLEAMKTETAFYAPVGGTVREVLARPGERVAAGDVLLVIEPRPVAGIEPGQRIELPEEPDPLALLLDGSGGPPSLADAGELSSSMRGAAVTALRREARRILMGYDVNPARADLLVAILEGSLEGSSPGMRAELAQLGRVASAYADIETLFSRSPTRLEDDALGPSNDARMAMYLRRIDAEGIGIEPAFLEQVRRALRHYDVESLSRGDSLHRAVLRIFATRTTTPLRERVITGLLHLMIRLGEAGETFERYPEFREALRGILLLRGSSSDPVVDLASQASFRLYEQPQAQEREEGSDAAVDFELTSMPASDPAGLARRARELGLEIEEAERIELWRLDEFDLERIESTPGVHAFYGRARSQPEDERLLYFADVPDLPGAPEAPDLVAFEQRFHAVIEAMRSIQGTRDPNHRFQWNRLYLFVRPPIVLTNELLSDALRRLSPETLHLGLERVVVRIARVTEGREDAPPERVEIVAQNPTGRRLEWMFRTPHGRRLAAATPYERRVAEARARGLVYPYEIVRLFTAPAPPDWVGPGRPTGPGHFVEYDLLGDGTVPVDRPPGRNSCGVVIGVINTPTRKHPDGMRRVLVLGDPTQGMGALAAPECARIAAAIDLAERERLPVEWVAVSSGARISMDSGTENLDATARVVRRLVTFTDQRGEVNLILPGVNVGAQSYFDALATMGTDTRGILIMLSSASMVLTGRAALEVSGGVSAEDEIGIGGYERIMGPTGQAHFQARDLAAAYAILLDHYATSYLAAGEDRPRRFPTADPSDRDITESAYDSEEDFDSISELFSADANPGRKRPFAMRPLMSALVDQDAGHLELWNGWTGGGETAIVWNAHVGGIPVALIGVESRATGRIGHVPNDGPETWTAGTLFPQSSKKIARALNAASGNRPAVILANLSGFDGSPESMRRGVLEYGAEIARAVVRFRGRILFAVVSRYHGGAYVVFSRALNDQMHAAALSGSYASVIGGAAAASVVFPREVRRRANADPRVAEARARVDAAADPATRVARRAEFERVHEQVALERQAEVAAEFDGIHTVERALEVGSIEAILDPRELRPTLIAWLDEL
ncbi:MAG: carboxyl transferase domain-containing protein [Myxococcota bacterium]|nr:carboxyl transferase domain-containing protein [Myxococcota bacterium]